MSAQKVTPRCTPSPMKLDGVALDCSRGASRDVECSPRCPSSALRVAHGAIGGKFRRVHEAFVQLPRRSRARQALSWDAARIRLVELAFMRLVDVLRIPAVCSWE